MRFSPHEFRLTRTRATNYTKRPAPGFSLTELLIVTALISCLAAIGAGSFSGIQTSDQKKALINVSNALEAARQAAVTYNTYTYVAFTSPADPSNAASPLCVASFQSATGSDVLRGALTGGQALLPEGQSPGRPGSWRLLSRPSWLRNASVESTRDVPATLLPANERVGSGFSTTIGPVSGGNAFRINRKLGDMPAAAVLNFDRVVTFSPSGSAFVDNSLGLPVASIGVLIKPRRTAVATAADEAQIAAVLVNGLLGSARIYQLESR